MAVERIQTHDGLSLVVEHGEVPTPRAHLLIVHGYAEHRGRYAELVGRLEAHGIACHRFDLRGHGTSEGPRAYVPRFRNYLEDLDRVLTSVRARSAAAPLLLLGHSLGGLITLEYIRTHPAACRAFAVSSPYLGPAFHVPRLKAILARALSFLAPKLLLPNGLRPQWVSRDEETVAAYRNDPLVFDTTTPRWFVETTAAQRSLIAHAGEITTPALFLLAGSDRIADHRIALDVFARLGDSEFLGVPRSSSGSSEEPGARLAEELRGTRGTPRNGLRIYPDLYHEVFNETAAAREAVIGDLLAWLDSTLARTLHVADSSGGMHE